VLNSRQTVNTSNSKYQMNGKHATQSTISNKHSTPNNKR